MTLLQHLRRWAAGRELAQEIESHQSTKDAYHHALRRLGAVSRTRQALEATLSQRNDRIRDLENALLKVSPNSREPSVADVLEEYVYPKSGTVKRVALTGNRVHFPASGITAQVGPDGTLTLLDGAGPVATFERA